MAEDNNDGQQASGMFGWVSQASGVSLASGSVMFFAGLWLLGKISEDDWAVPATMVWFMLTASVLLVTVSVAIKFHDALLRDENYDELIDKLFDNPKMSDKVAEKLADELPELRGGTFTRALLAPENEPEPPASSKCMVVICDQDVVQSFLEAHGLSAPDC